jgi:hypothetical protein
LTYVRRPKKEKKVSPLDAAGEDIKVRCNVA